MYGLSARTQELTCRLFAVNMSVGGFNGRMFGENARVDVPTVCGERERWRVQRVLMTKQEWYERKLRN
ncbi:MAG: hypothetical protein ACI4JZ_08245 [Oscillospiraceae bacterium]